MMAQVYSRVGSGSRRFSRRMSSIVRLGPDLPSLRGGREALEAIALMGFILPRSGFIKFHRLSLQKAQQIEADLLPRR